MLKCLHNVLKIRQCEPAGTSEVLGLQIKDWQSAIAQVN